MRNGQPVTTKFYETKHGVILHPTEFEKGFEHGPYNHIDPNNEHKHQEYHLRYAFASPLVEKGRNPVQYFVKMMKSKNLIEFKGWLGKFRFPNLNLVMADTSDNIGYYTTGSIPIRAHQETHDGTLPLPGWLSDYDWKGYIQEDIMPYSINPKIGYIVSCNQKIVDDTKYPYYLGCGYSDGFRAQRVMDLINEKINKQEKNRSSIY